MIAGGKRDATATHLNDKRKRQAILSGPFSVVTMKKQYSESLIDEECSFVTPNSEFRSLLHVKRPTLQSNAEQISFRSVLCVAPQTCRTHTAELQAERLQFVVQSTFASPQEGPPVGVLCAGILGNLADLVLGAMNEDST